MMVCRLCGEEKDSYRRCKFGEKQRDLCMDCRNQFKIVVGRIVLYESNEVPSEQTLKRWNKNWGKLK